MSRRGTARSVGRRAAGAAVVGAVVATVSSAVLTTPAEAATAHTYRGTTAQTPYGPVAVSIRVVGSKVTTVTATTYPRSDSHSARISAYAVPRLQQQALAAQSASISGVSGASYTSAAFERSLQSALAKAGLA